MECASHDFRGADFNISSSYGGKEEKGKGDNNKNRTTLIPVGGNTELKKKKLEKKSGVLDRTHTFNVNTVELCEKNTFRKISKF